MTSREEFVLYLDSDHVVENVKGTFAYADPPPTQMTIKVRLPTLTGSRERAASSLKVPLDHVS